MKSSIIVVYDYKRDKEEKEKEIAQKRCLVFVYKKTPVLSNIREFRGITSLILSSIDTV
jgi:hypothetical protein